MQAIASHGFCDTFVIQATESCGVGYTFGIQIQESRDFFELGIYHVMGGGVLGEGVLCPTDSVAILQLLLMQCDCALENHVF